jgi:hypothetical protein
MSTEAFKSRRVTESLRAVTKYLDEGARIAGSISPPHIIRIEPEEVPRPPSPRLTRVVPRVITLNAGEGNDEFTLTVSGSGLDSSKEFKLVRGADQVAASELTEVSDDGFTATFPIDPEQVTGLYDAWVLNETGQTFILDDACRLRVDSNNGHRSGGHAGVAADTQPFHTGGAVPMGAPGETLDVMIASRGGPPPDITKWSVTDSEGRTRDGWVIELAKKRKGPAAPGPANRQPQLIPLTVTIPRDEVAGTYFLLAQPKSADPRGRLAFYVDVQKSQQSS